MYLGLWEASKALLGSIQHLEFWSHAAVCGLEVSAAARNAKPSEGQSLVKALQAQFSSRLQSTQSEKICASCGHHRHSHPRFPFLNEMWVDQLADPSSPNSSAEVIHPAYHLGCLLIKMLAEVWACSSTLPISLDNPQRPGTVSPYMNLQVVNFQIEHVFHQHQGGRVNRSLPSTSCCWSSVSSTISRPPLPLQSILFCLFTEFSSPCMAPVVCWHH